MAANDAIRRLMVVLHEKNPLLARAVATLPIMEGCAVIEARYELEPHRPAEAADIVVDRYIAAIEAHYAQGH